MVLARKKAQAPVEVFKTRKTRVKTADDTALSPPEPIAVAIDDFRESSDQEKHFKGLATVYKDTILAFARPQYAQRLISGLDGSFKILGASSAVTFVVTDDASGLAEDEVDVIAGRWGKKLVTELIMQDFGSLRFDKGVLEANYKTVVKALRAGIPEDILDKLFQPMLMKAVPGAAKIAALHAKNCEELTELLASLKVKAYLK